MKKVISIRAQYIRAKMLGLTILLSLVLYTMITVLRQ